MPRRRNNPNIPYAAFGEGRLPPRLRRRLVRRADSYARRIYGPEIQALRNQRQGIQRQYRRDVQNARGAIEFTDRAIGQVPLKGLRGRYRQEVAGEVAASRVDNRKALPALTAEARATRGASMSDLRTEILGAKIEQQQTAARTLNSLLDEARTDAESYLKSRKGKEGSKLTSREGVRSAIINANNALAIAKKKPWEYDNPEQRELAWKAIELEAAGEAATPIEARRAIKLLRARIARRAQGRLTDVGLSGLGMFLGQTAPPLATLLGIGRTIAGR